MSQALIVFSHLRWNFVYQRPQHLMSRMAAHYDVYFVEEPVHDDDPPFVEVCNVECNIRVCRPHTPVNAVGFHDEQLPVLKKLLARFIADEGIEDPLVWLYTPMALPLVQSLRPRAIVYDCMDELAAFRNAPRQLLQRESALLQAADIVFTGGPSLYRAKQPRHHSVHCFPSSVEHEHFARAQDASIEHPSQAALPRPRLGFYGVIDERFDLALLTHMADAKPDWQIVIVGPIVKIDAAKLPLRANIHYVEQQAYADLPRFLAAWDVCLLPFALNDSTRYISPTKTLEYMAAGKPIVSTPITDVVEPYAGIVEIGATPEEFVAACERVLNSTPAESATRAAKMRNAVERTSWDRTAASMHELLQGACTTRRKERAIALLSAPAARDHHSVVIIGAGPTGLSAAYHVGEDSLLLEQHDRVGGWCRSITDAGFTFDYAGHIMFSNDAYVHQLYRLLLGDNVHWQDREAWIYSKSVYTRYPFQGALYGLPPDVLKDCLIGAIEARFGALQTQPGRSSGHGPAAGKAESITDCCGDGVAETAASLGLTAAPPMKGVADGKPRNFEEFIYKVWGWGVAEHFALPYNRKLWAVPLAEMETSWLGGRVPMPDLEEMIEGALRPVAKPMGPNARFGYPLRGGFQALVDGFVPHLEGELKLNARVAHVNAAEHEVVLEDGTVHAYDQLVSTMPLPVLVRMLGAEAPPRVRQAAAGLRHVSVRCVNLGIAREHVTEKHWIYYPESSVFHRIFVQGNASPACNPAGGFGLTCEITYSPLKPLPCDGDALIERCIADCVDVGIIRADDSVIARNQIDMPYAYVVYDHDRAAHVSVIREWLAEQDIVLAGRYSEWEYYNSDHAFLAGRKAADAVLAARKASAASSALSRVVGAKAKGKVTAARVPASS